MDDAGPAHARNVSRAGVDPVIVPDCFARMRIMVDEKPAPVLLGKNSGETPGQVRQIADVQQIDDHQIAGFGAFDPKWSAQIMHLGQIDVANVIGAVIGGDLATRPIEAFDPEFCSRLIGFHHRNVGMPAVVGFYLPPLLASFSDRHERLLWALKPPLCFFAI